MRLWWDDVNRVGERNGRSLCRKVGSPGDEVHRFEGVVRRRMWEMWTGWMPCIRIRCIGIPYIGIPYIRIIVNRSCPQSVLIVLMGSRAMVMAGFARSTVCRMTTVRTMSCQGPVGQTVIVGLEGQVRRGPERPQQEEDHQRGVREP